MWDCWATALSPARAEDLTSVVQQALSNHPELAAIRFNRHAIDHELTAARGLKLPTVDVRSDVGRHREYDRNALGIVTNDDYHRHREHSIIMSQRLFDGFEARHEEARQRNRVELARWRVAERPIPSRFAQCRPTWNCSGLRPC